MKLLPKSLTILPLILITSSSLALCDYHDKIEFKGASGLKVMSISGANPVSASKVNDSTIELNTSSYYDTNNGQNICPGDSAVATIKVGTSDTAYCTLSLRDGAFMFDPKLENINCTGLQFTSMYVEAYHTYVLYLS